MGKTNEIVERLRAKTSELSFPFRSYQVRNNCLFIHIPKTAGTSILKALGKKGGRRDHLPWYVYATANPHYFSRIFKFAFVRNPWDRTLSSYRYLLSGGNQQGDIQTRQLLEAYNDFSEFVIKGLGEGEFRNHLLFIPQSEFVVNGNSELAVDFLGRYENLAEDFKFVANSLRLPDQLDWTNQNSRKIKMGYADFYGTGKAADIVGEIYKQDIKLFGYNF